MARKGAACFQPPTLNRCGAAHSRGKSAGATRAHRGRFGASRDGGSATGMSPLLARHPNQGVGTKMSPVKNVPCTISEGSSFAVCGTLCWKLASQRNCTSAVGFAGSNLRAMRPITLPYGSVAPDLYRNAWQTCLRNCVNNFPFDTLCKKPCGYGKH